MLTRCFERNNEVININEYGFEWYRDDKLIGSGLVDGYEETIESLIEDGWEEVV